MDSEQPAPSETRNPITRRRFIATAALASALLACEGHDTEAKKPPSPPSIKDAAFVPPGEYQRRIEEALGELDASMTPAITEIFAAATRPEALKNLLSGKRGLTLVIRPDERECYYIPAGKSHLPAAELHKKHGLAAVLCFLDAVGKVNALYAEAGIRMQDGSPERLNPEALAATALSRFKDKYPVKGALAPSLQDTQAVMQGVINVYERTLHSPSTERGNISYVSLVTGKEAATETVTITVRTPPAVRKIIDKQFKIPIVITDTPQERTMTP